MTGLHLRTDLLLPIFSIAVDQKWPHCQPSEQSSSPNVVHIGAIVQIVVSCCEVVSPQWYLGSRNAAAASPKTASYCYLCLVFDKTPPTDWSAADGTNIHRVLMFVWVLLFRKWVTVVLIGTCINRVLVEIGTYNP